MNGFLVPYEYSLKLKKKGVITFPPDFMFFIKNKLEFCRYNVSFSILPVHLEKFNIVTNCI